MKSTVKNKVTFTALILAAAISVSVYSCKKDNSTTTASTAATEADIAEVTTDAVSTSTGGMVLQLNSSVNVYKTVALSCGTEKDSTITKTSATGATPSYGYSLKWAYMLNCSGVVPSQLTFNFTGSSNYDGARMSSNDSSTGSFVLVGLQNSATGYTFTSNYVRNGSQTSKIGNKNTFTSKLTITSSNIVVDKTSLLIVSGTATVTATGTSTNGDSFTYGGTVTFLGNNKATLVLNSGTSYAISW